ncbi:MAG: 30S ribosome-binding factor RbfA [Oscillospiraceae bacterium]|jgi:ribosome-binding factor A|nr:30S ribosome-binding factor RbfA [Oscillospiraceae bacterium]
MPSYRISRINEDIKREMTAILRKLRDPRIQNKIISVAHVDVTPDLSLCKVYISAIAGLDSANRAVAILKAASGFIKREIGCRLKLRYIPEFLFFSTDFIEYASKIDKILSEIENKTHAKNIRS